jgi:N-acetyltransferase 10
MGYGSRCLELLSSFYQGEFSALNENEDYQQEDIVRVDDAELEVSTCQVNFRYK